MKQESFDGRDGDVLLTFYLNGGKLEVTRRNGSNVLEIRGTGESISDVLYIQPQASNVVHVALGDYLPHYESNAMDARKKRVRKKRRE